MRTASFLLVGLLVSVTHDHARGQSRSTFELFATCGESYDCRVIGQALWMARQSGSAVTYDLRDPNRITNYRIPVGGGSFLASANGIPSKFGTTSGHLLPLISNVHGAMIQFLDVTSPDAIKSVGSMELPNVPVSFSTGSDAWAVATQDRSFVLIDMSDPARAVITQSWKGTDLPVKDAPVSFQAEPVPFFGEAVLSGDSAYAILLSFSPNSSALCPVIRLLP